MTPTESAEPEAQPADEAEAEKKAEQEEEIVEETGELPRRRRDPRGREGADVRPRHPPAASGGGGGGGGGTSVTLPALGESVTEGTVTRWLK